MKVHLLEIERFRPIQGSLRPEHILGRDELIARYRMKLETHSIARLAPRRVGKTSIAKRMSADPPERFVVHSRDLEDLESVVHARIENRIVVLIWDEFTYFVSELALNGHERDAMALLDSLRAARQNYQNVRMVLTGSIGLPEIERRLRNAGHRIQLLVEALKAHEHIDRDADGPGLLRALRAKKTIDLDPAVEYALTADDTPQAFVRMGAEVRRFCRSLLQNLQLDDVLATLPPEPTDDPI